MLVNIIYISIVFLHILEVLKYIIKLSTAVIYTASMLVSVLWSATQ